MSNEGPYGTFPNIFCPVEIKNRSSHDATAMTLWFSCFNLIGVTCVIILMNIIRRYRCHTYSLDTQIKRSVFGSQHKKLRYLLYFALIFGPFYYRIVCALLVASLQTCSDHASEFGGSCWRYSMAATTIDSVLEVVNFFVAMFLINLYGYKWEVLVRYGYPVIPDEEKKNFVRSCLKKALVLSIIYLIMYLLSTIFLSTDWKDFNYNENFSFYKFIKNLVMCTLMLQRYYIVNSYKEVSDQKRAVCSKKQEIDIYSKTIADHYPSRNIVVKQIRNEETPLKVKDWLAQSLDTTDRIIKEKINILQQNAKESFAPIPRNYKEPYIAGNVLLTCLFADTAVYTIFSFILLITNSESPDDSTDPSNLSLQPGSMTYVIIVILFIFYIAECIVLPYLFYHVMKDQKVLGVDLDKHSADTSDYESIERNFYGSVLSMEIVEDSSREWDVARSSKLLNFHLLSTE